MSKPIAFANFSNSVASVSSENNMQCVAGSVRVPAQPCLPHSLWNHCRALGRKTAKFPLTSLPWLAHLEEAETRGAEKQPAAVRHSRILEGKGGFCEVLDVLLMNNAPCLLESNEPSWSIWRATQVTEVPSFRAQEPWGFHQLGLLLLVPSNTSASYWKHGMFASRA